MLHRLVHPLWISAIVGMTGPNESPAQESSAAPRIDAISSAMKRCVDDREVAGVVTLVATPEKVIHLDAVGKADIEKDIPMSTDAIVWIASMTKPITGAAVLMLQDEGKLSVDDLVETYIPEFAALTTESGKPAKITIKHLLTHSSGLDEGVPAELRKAKTLAEAVPHYLKKPVHFTPGSKWTYCQSGINTAARIVEIVSGKSFDAFLDERLFKPLGMKDTSFYLTEAQLPRLAKSYRRTEQGELVATTNFFLSGKTPTSRDRFPAANGGLFSTATDYSRFARMLLNKGELDGKRYLSEKAVAQMSSLQSGDLKTGFTPGCAWGIGVCLVREPQGVTAPLSPGTFGHGGAYGTQAWIDPVQKRVHILIVQRANFSNSDASPVRKAFHEAAR